MAEQVDQAIEDVVDIIASWLWCARYVPTEPQREQLRTALRALVQAVVDHASRSPVSR